MSEDDKITYEDIVRAVVMLEDTAKKPWVIRPHPYVLAWLREIFTEDEIVDIFKGKGLGWDKYIEIVRDNDET